jgi:hypothetical protein
MTDDYEPPVLPDDAKDVLHRIIRNDQAERCLVVRNDHGDIVDIISAADLDRDAE